MQPSRRKSAKDGSLSKSFLKGEFGPQNVGL
jgi:hypothetical protein